MAELYHYGVPRRSGRYPWGSGDDPYQHSSTWLSQYREYRDQGMSDNEIAKALGMSSTQFRAKKSIETDNELAQNVARAQSLLNTGMSKSAIGREMGVNESTVRSWLQQAEKQRYDDTKNTAAILKDNVDSKKFIDVGVGVEKDLGVSQTKLNTAVAMLQEQGYELYSVKVPQATMPGQYTWTKVLAPPGTTWADVNFNQSDIKSIENYSPDNGKTFWKPEYPESISSKRILIRYAEEGGEDKDGLIELRRGVEDLSMDNSNYAQVRIAVDGTHYAKGMALYSDDIPDGYDMVVNTNKHVGTPMLGAKDHTVLKNMDNDPENPFGASIKAQGQHHYFDKDGNEKLGVVNKLKEEGDWDTQHKALPSQFLSKQSISLMKQQLNLSYTEKKDELSEIQSLTLPAVKRKLLNSFADKCDADAADLQAAALPRQTTKVIIPLTKMSENEVYAPGYRNGEKVVLIRYPHGGTFEIPELVVNNKNQDGIKTLGKNPVDAIGINKKVADKLSGADFDGDTVTLIPVNDRVKIKTSPTLSQLEGFDPKEQYPGYSGMKRLTSQRKGVEMGNVSNLITDMTLKGATPEELSRAVKHSMVVIDAEKHNLNYKKSEEDNGIAALKKKYQGKSNAGAATLISKASAPLYIDERKDGKKVTDPLTGKTKVQYVDPETGKKLYTNTERYYYSKKAGKMVKAQFETKKMLEVDDARNLSSGTPQEEVYANYANKLKALANTARKESLSVKDTPLSPSAKEIYKAERDSLDSKLNVALKNAPRERQAQIIANAQIKAQKQENPDMSKDDIKKYSNRAMASARAKVGASKKNVYVEITDREWEAIQAGAISANKLEKIINNTDSDALKQRATPRSTASISTSKINRIKAMANSGHTTAEIADALNLSSSTVSNYLKGERGGE